MPFTGTGPNRSHGNTKNSLCSVYLPEGLAKELLLWKGITRIQHRMPSSFPTRASEKGAQQNSFIFTDNYRTRMLNPWAEKLGLPKLNFQVLRRTMAILAQTKGNVKDVQTILGHSKPDTTVNVYMQPIEESVSRRRR